MTQNIITIKNLRFRWGGNKHYTLDIENWSIAKRSRIFLYGPSGSGKSTLLNTITGILKPQYGSIDILGQDLVQLSQNTRDKFRAQHMGVIFQQFNLIPYLSTADNIQISNGFTDRPANKERLLELTKPLGLHQELLDQKANQLSVGQQQRVAVARALYHQPDIIIADEPTSSLDSDNRDEFIKLLLEQSTANKSTVIFVSHDKQLATHFDIMVNLSELNKAEASKSVI
jgi:putative ABC transport system ATP-binding protein